jgi:anthranilate synthase component 2
LLLVIDNYDSFTYNLVQYLCELGAEVEVRRNDAVGVDDVARLAPLAVIISPGPGRPEEAGVTLPLVREAGARLPILGVCLGHQAIGLAYGGRVVLAPALMHGKTSRIRHRGGELFDGVESPFVATRYHSLMVAREGLPPDLEVTAEADDGVIMGLRHRRHPVFGVQFHPESILTPAGRRILGNFLSIVERFHSNRGVPVPCRSS